MWGAALIQILVVNLNLRITCYISLLGEVRYMHSWNQSICLLNHEMEVLAVTNRELRDADSTKQAKDTWQAVHKNCCRK